MDSMTALRQFSIFALLSLFASLALALLFFPELLLARNINQYKDTLSTSAPSTASNHTLSFVVGATLAPSSYIEIIPPAGFEVTNVPTFAPERNVELRVNGSLRDVGSVVSVTDDFVDITPGSPGLIRYTLNSSIGIAAGSQIEIKIGNHTSRANAFSEVFDVDLQATTTTEADTEPIINASTVGTHMVDVKIYDGVQVADAGFLIALVDRVGVGPIDTRELVPPYRFNGSPTGTLSGTTVGVEITLETDELATCKYSLSPDVSYDDISTRFTTTGSIYHAKVVIVTPGSVNRFYVRCMDDEFNKNIDDYIIQFVVNAAPTGISNTVGSTSGDGTGSGNDGGGSGAGGGGTSGSSDGDNPTTGAQSGGGGSGGGSGGGGGGGSGANGGGGFESADGPYRSGDAQVVISGFTAPRSTVTALVDGKITETTTANASGEFSVTISAIARGAYTFGIYSTDASRVKSTTFSTSFTVTGARESALSNVLIAPTILATPDPVNPGQALTLSGYSIPNATITLENEKDGSTASRKQYTAQSTSNGVWSISVDTTGFQTGTYKTRAKAAQTTTLVTSFSSYVLYGVGQAATKTLNSDLNRDGKVNLTDFSILLFWWNSNGGTSDPSADINGDAKVNLTDFSILLFNWTG